MSKISNSKPKNDNYNKEKNNYYTWKNSIVFDHEWFRP